MRRVARESSYAPLVTVATARMTNPMANSVNEYGVIPEITTYLLTMAITPRITEIVQRG